MTPSFPENPSAIGPARNFGLLAVATLLTVVAAACVAMDPCFQRVALMTGYMLCIPSISILWMWLRKMPLCDLLNYVPELLVPTAPTMLLYNLAAFSHGTGNYILLAGSAILTIVALAWALLLELPTRMRPWVFWSIVVIQFAAVAVITHYLDRLL